MNYPKMFYSLEAESKSQYQTEATGNPDIHRLLQGHTNYWISPASSTLLKKKKLVLADWSIASWSYSKLIAIQAILQKLIDDGFDVYLCEDNDEGIKPQKKIECYQLEKHSLPPLISDIKKTMSSQYQLSSDQYLILDQAWIECLLNNEKEPKSHTLSLYSVFQLNKEEDNLDTLIDWLIDSKTSIDSLVNDLFCMTPGGYHDKEVESYWVKLCKAFPISKKITDYRHALLDKKGIEYCYSHSDLELEAVTNLILKDPVTGEELSNLLDIMPQVRSILLSLEADHGPLPEAKLHQLAELNFQLNSKTDLHGLLKCTPNLLSLYLEEYDIHAEMPMLDSSDAALSLPLLKQFVLINLCYKPESLQAILEIAPHLEEIYISHNIRLPGQLSLKENSLKQLQRLYARDSFLNVWLKAAPSVKKIDVEDLSTLSLTPGSLPFLEEIDLAYATLSAEMLQEVLQATPKLQVLNLNSCRNLASTFSLAPNSLPALERLYLSRINVSEVLEVLFHAAPNLQVIYLANHTLEGTLFLVPGSLPLLENLYLSHAKVPGNMLQLLLQAAPGLKEISFERYSFSDLLSLSPKSLPLLEDIDLTGSTVSNEILANLLEAAPNLRTIDLTNCTVLSALPAFPKNSLPRLHYLTINAAIHNVHSLLEAAPNLECLDLTVSSFILVTLKPNSLPQLNTIHLRGKSLGSIKIPYPLSTAFLDTLLTAAPALKTLYVDNIILDNTAIISTQPRALPLLENINIEYSILHAAHLQTLLLTAPCLHELELDLYSSLKGELSLTPNSLLSLEFIQYGGEFSNHNRRILIEAAPNCNLLEQGVNNNYTAAGAVSGKEGEQSFRRESGYDEYPIDADTKVDDVTLHASRIFYPVLTESENTPVNNYRLDVFTKIEINPEVCSMGDAFLLKKSDELDLIDREMGDGR